MPWVERLLRDGRVCNSLCSAPSRHSVRSQFVFAALSGCAVPREVCALIAGYASDWALVTSGDRYVKFWSLRLLLAPVLLHQLTNLWM